MSVLMPNTRLGLRRRVEGAVNSHGERTSQGFGVAVGLYPGLTEEAADAMWTLGLDPKLWPVRQYDLVFAPDGSSWIVQSADLLQNSFDSTVDWVRVTAARRTDGGSTPAGAWFVGRYEDYVQPTPTPTDGGDPVIVQAHVWTGWGPPPEPSAAFPAEVGDEYIDMNTGIVYRLGEE